MFEMSMNPSLRLEGPQSGSESLTGPILSGWCALLRVVYSAVLLH